MATHFLGIRHHGSGSAARVLQALDTLQPDCVLIEGPSDCNELLPLLASQSMRPPVALLAYASEAPEQHIYFPFAEFSPEYQAVCWAVKQGARLEFIDLPVQIQLAGALEERKAAKDAAAEGEVREGKVEPAQQSTPEKKENTHLHSDPIDAMAKLAGYQDGESWWNDYLEQNHNNSQELFTTIANLMTELRAAFPDEDENCAFYETNTAREAFMRLQIAAAAKQSETIAVVCGAWHVPALQESIALKVDRETIKALPKKLSPSKVKTTWIPWTSTRLSHSSGYGAGVPAPMWYQHLWDSRGSASSVEMWLGKIATVLRAAGHVVSTASIIEAVRLSSSLAAVRGRSTTGFEEITDALIACLCFGERRLWDSFAPELLLGNEVGEIPPDTPLAPLLEDLQHQQKACKLKPEALEKELSLDLRSDSGGRRSRLLHRLKILGVPWGEIREAGNSRGTFRENWLLAWKPEYSVELVENLIYGNTIEQAASNKIIATIKTHLPLDRLAESVVNALIADLPSAASFGLKRLDVQASQSDNAFTLLSTIVPLIHVSRYGTARAIDLKYLQSLIERLTVQTALTLPFACRNLNQEEAEQYRASLSQAHHAILLTELPNAVLENWWAALEEISQSNSSNLLLSGLTTRFLYQAERLSDEDLQTYFARCLSPAIPALDAAQYFSGFFTGITQQLQYNDALRVALEHWLLGLAEDDFISHLPLFKRVFSDLDATERARLLQKLLGKAERSAVVYQPLAEDFSTAQLTLFMELFCE